MKKFFTLLAVLITMNGMLFSQITFEKFFDDSSEEFGTSVIETANGYMFCGTILDDVNGDYDIFVTSTNLNGIVNWTNIYTSLGTGDDEATYINATSDGNFVITGFTTDPTTGDEDVFILKINASGTELWNETYDGGTGEDDGANYIVEGEANTLLVCGYSYDGTNSDMWVFQTNSTGTQIWDEFYGLNGDDEAFCLIETVDNGLAIVGESYDDVNGDYDGVLVKTDSLGVEDWTYYTTGTGDESFNDIIIDSYGDFLVVGKEEDITNSDYDILIENVSFDGNTIYYSHNYDYSGGDDEAYRVYADGSDVYIVGEVEDVNNNDFDAYFAHINDATGNIVGDVLYGDILDDGFSDFDFTSDQGFICVGYSQASATDFDVYLVKTDENGLVTTKITQSIKYSSIKVYPNPVSDFINISGALNYDKFEIVNFTGQVVLESSYNNNSIDVSNLESGVYFINLYSNGNKFSSKFIKQ
ncbi:MAG: T9SS type A sorting domain-containing protein [Bacteroidales bacterium]|nr:T9SS type A sorting domain-containing protein [Bacteroidales bacterium]